MADERGTGLQGGMQLHRREGKHVDFIVMGADRKVLVVGRELDVLKPLFHGAFLGHSHLPIVLPVAGLVYSELSTSEAHGAKATVCRDVYASGLCAERELPVRWIRW